MMAYNNVIGLDLMGARTCSYVKRRWENPAGMQHSPMLSCVYEDPSRADELRKGWSFRVGTWINALLQGDQVN